MFSDNVRNFSALPVRRVDRVAQRANVVDPLDAIARVGTEAGWPAPAASHRVQQVGGQRTFGRTGTIRTRLVTAPFVPVSARRRTCIGQEEVEYSLPRRSSRRPVDAGGIVHGSQADQHHRRLGFARAPADGRDGGRGRRGQR